MALVNCPECSAQISDRAAFCPHCGLPMALPKNELKKPVKRSNRKHPKLPNGYGSIKKLTGRRSNPYGVYPPVTEFTLDGLPVQPKAIAYAKDWYSAFGLLSAWHAGTFQPGQEAKFDVSQITDDFVQGIVAAFNYGNSLRLAETDLKFSEVYEQYVQWDFGGQESDDPDKLRRLRKRKSSMRAAYQNCSQLHNMIFRNLRYKDLQAVVDQCPLKHASKELIVVLFHKMYKYAQISEIQPEDYSKHVAIKSEDDDISGVPFSMNELKRIWDHRDDPVLEMIFIMCLSGFRISAYGQMEVNLEGRYFRGGVKTKNGRDRIVPIHSLIFPLVKSRIERYGKILPFSPASFRVKLYQSLETIGIEKHTPHDCRDTFATLCDAAGVDRFYLKRLVGHSLSSDITEDKYIHPSLDSLRAEIEKIDLSLFVTNGFAL